MSPEAADSDAAAPSSADGAASFPNWRVVDVRADATRAAVAPFCHPTAAGPTAAPWSAAALRAGLDLHARLTACDDPSLAPSLLAALSDLDAAYRLYGPHCTVGSYNGGKDAVAVFHLLRAAHAKHCDDRRREDPGFAAPRPRVIYFQNPDEFPEVLTLLEATVAGFDADMLAFAAGTSYPDGLRHLVERNLAPAEGSAASLDPGSPLPAPRPLAFVLGTRRGDPNAGDQGVYAPSSPYMPPFLRVNPVLDWSYGQVWNFLRAFDLPYCSLYDQGYTSLGTVKDTRPCPALKRSGGGYRPAHMLEDWDQERAGRVSKKKGTKGEGTAAPASGPARVVEAVSPAPLATAVAAKATAAGATAAAAGVHASAGRPPTVGLIVIGDELLKGMTPDINIFAAAKALRSHGVPLSRVSVISDHGPHIVEEIRRFTEEVDVIITSGGVGPTHDDITMTSVAEALGLELEVHCEMAELLLEKMGSARTDQDGDGDDAHAPNRRQVLTRQMSQGQEKMATLPTSAVLRYLTGDANEWPVMQCQHVFVLPGVPQYFENNIKRLAAHLPTAPSAARREDGGTGPPPRAGRPAPRCDTQRLVLSLEEDALVVALNASVAAHPHVSFGSYPIVDDPRHKTIVTLEGRRYNGGYAAGARAGGARAEGADAGPSEFFFSKEEMDGNVARALADIKSRLPEAGIVCIDSCDDLRIR